VRIHDANADADADVAGNGKMLAVDDAQRQNSESDKKKNSKHEITRATQRTRWLVGSTGIKRGAEVFVVVDDL
jgi:hypothetical protein